jgi:hypothetical protein
VFAEFDNAYGVSGWRTPGSRKKIVTRREDSSIPDDAPAWWQGDEEASQSFLLSAGVKL